MMDITLRPIGHLETPWASPSECPRNGRQPDPAPACRAVVDEAYRAGLTGIEGFSHLILVYWMHQAAAPEKRPLVFTPPFDDTPRGVFTTRAPFHPNALGLSVVALDGFEAPGVLRVRWLDCVTGTPLLDIKPYLPTTDAVPAASMGWLTPHATRPKT